MLATLRTHDFQSLKNAPCKLTITEDCDIEVELMKITEKPNAAISLDNADIRILFSLLFKIPLEQAFEGDYCHFHPPRKTCLLVGFFRLILKKTAWYQIVFA